MSNRNLFKFNYTFPAKTEPEWAGKVDRWYQLDAPAYGFCEAYWAWKNDGKLKSPTTILLASEGASNLTDFDFIQSGASSPAKFAHTLPNIRFSPLCQLMNWSGPVLCLQKDPSTTEIALEEASLFIDNQESVVWVLGSKSNDLNESFEINLVQLEGSLSV